VSPEACSYVVYFRKLVCSPCDSGRSTREQPSCAIVPGGVDLSKIVADADDGHVPTDRDAGRE
jgi:hypothetical protein